MFGFCLWGFLCLLIVFVLRWFEQVKGLDIQAAFVHTQFFVYQF